MNNIFFLRSRYAMFRRWVPEFKFDTSLNIGFPSSRNWEDWRWTWKTRIYEYKLYLIILDHWIGSKSKAAQFSWGSRCLKINTRPDTGKNEGTRNATSPFLDGKACICLCNIICVWSICSSRGWWKAISLDAWGEYSVTFQFVFYTHQDNILYCTGCQTKYGIVVQKEQVHDGC